MPRPLKLVSIAHSYVVALNRRLAHELAKVGEGRWEVTAVAPDYFHGRRDLRPMAFEPLPAEPCRTEVIPAHLTRLVHVFRYGRRLKSILAEGWDLVHAWEEPFIVAGAQIAWQTPRETPLVYASFQNLSKHYPPPFNAIEKYSMRRAAGWIAFGESVAQVLSDRPGYRDRPGRVIPVGVDMQQFRPDAAAGEAVRRGLSWEISGPPVIGFLGRLVEEKGIRLLLRTL